MMDVHTVVEWEDSQDCLIMLDWNNLPYLAELFDYVGVRYHNLEGQRGDH